MIARFDLADEVLRLAVEVDGKAGHAGTVMAAKDRERDRVSERHGWRTERVTWFELRCRRRAFVAPGPGGRRGPCAPRLAPDAAAVTSRPRDEHRTRRRVRCRERELKIIGGRTARVAAVRAPAS